MSELYDGIMQGLNEAAAYASGELKLKATKLTVVPVREYKANEVKKIRDNLGMTQVLFANFMGVSPKTVESWEAGRNIPNGPASRILSMVEADPKLPERFNFVSR